MRLIGRFQSSRDRRQSIRHGGRGDRNGSNDGTDRLTFAPKPPPRHQVPKSKRTSPASIFRRASNFLPAFDSNPLSTAVRPCLRSDWAVRTPMVFPAIFFQIANRHPVLQPLQPNDFSCSTTSAPQRGHGRARPPRTPTFFRGAGVASGRPGSPSRRSVLCPFLRAVTGRSSSQPLPSACRSAPESP